MILFKTITTFRERLRSLVNVRRGVYSGVTDELSKEFAGKTIEHIRQNNDMILIESDIIVVKLRLPDKRQRLSKRDGFRLIYIVSKKSELVVFLDIYPKNGPSQQLDIDNKEMKRLISEYVDEALGNLLEDYII